MNTLYSASFIITCLGALQWGLVGLGGFIGKNLNVIAFVSRGKTTIEYTLYLVVGLAAIAYIWLSAHPKTS